MRTARPPEPGRRGWAISALVGGAMTGRRPRARRPVQPGVGPNGDDPVARAGRGGRGRNSRIVAAVVAGVAAALVAGGCGSASKPVSPPSAVPPTITATYMSQFKGPVVTDQAGFALYVFQPDHRQRPTCTGSCAAIWPPVEEESDQRALGAPGLQANLIGSDTYTHTRSVVTYAGWPLYRYISDTRPGTAAGQALKLNGGYWYVIRPDGAPIVPAGDPAAP